MTKKQLSRRLDLLFTVVLKLEERLQDLIEDVLDEGIYDAKTNRTTSKRSK